MITVPEEDPEEPMMKRPTSKSTPSYHHNQNKWYTPIKVRPPGSSCLSCAVSGGIESRLRCYYLVFCILRVVWMQCGLFSSGSTTGFLSCDPHLKTR